MDSKEILVFQLEIEFHGAQNNGSLSLSLSHCRRATMDAPGTILFGLERFASVPWTPHRRSFRVEASFFFFFNLKKKKFSHWIGRAIKTGPLFYSLCFFFCFFVCFFVFCNRGTPLLHVAATATEKKIKIKWKKRMFHHLNKSAEDGWVDGRMQRKRKAKRKSESDGFDGRFVTLRRYWKRSISIWKK